MKSAEGKEQIRKVKELTKLAEGKFWGVCVWGGKRLSLSESLLMFWFFINHIFPSPELQTSVSALALAWVAKNPNTSTVILGASKPEQITENLKAIEVIPKLTPEVLHKIEKILDNEPDAHVRWKLTLICFFFFSFFFFLEF